MISEPETSEAIHEYAIAYTAHYSERDLPLALTLYEKLITARPNTQEADFSRMQIQNIINAVIPKQDRLEAQIEMARRHWENDVFSEFTEGSEASLALGFPV